MSADLSLNVDSDFSRILRLVVSETLDSFGEGVKTVVLFNLGQKFNASSEDVLCNTALLEAGLRDIFGMGSGLIEEKITQTICDVLKVDPNKLHGNFEEKMESIKQRTRIRRNMP